MDSGRKTLALASGACIPGFFWRGLDTLWGPWGWAIFCVGSGPGVSAWTRSGCWGPPPQPPGAPGPAALEEPATRGTIYGRKWPAPSGEKTPAGGRSSSLSAGFAATAVGSGRTSGPDTRLLHGSMGQGPLRGARAMGLVPLLRMTRGNPQGGWKRKISGRNHGHSGGFHLHGIPPGRPQWSSAATRSAPSQRRGSIPPG